MAGEINFGILDPKLGASFATGYNEAEDRRNELAARVQQRALGEQQLQHAMSQNELSKYTLSTAKRSDAQQEALNARVSSPDFNPNNPAHLQDLMRFGPPGQAMLKSIMDRAASEATLAKTKGEITAQDLKAAKDRHDALAGGLAPLAAAAQAGKPVTHQDVFGVAKQLLDQGIISPKDIASIPMQAERLPQYILGLATSNENSRKALEAHMAKPVVAGGNIVNMNPIFGPIGTNLAGVSMTPFETARVPILQQQANAATTQANTGVGRLAMDATTHDPFNLTGAAASFPLPSAPNAMATAPRVNALAAPPAAPTAPAPATAPTEATIGGKTAVPLRTAIAQGVKGNDLFASMPAPLAAQIAAIVDHRAAPPTRGSARADQMMQLIQMVDPTYDALAYGTKKGIETAFTSGRAGTTLKSLNVVQDHLGTFIDTVKGLENNPTQFVNVIKNKMATWGGAAAPTNFEAVKTVLADELTKAILGTAGALGDRQAMQASINSANSPEQLAGAVNQWQKLIAGQVKGMEDQYKSGHGSNAEVLKLFNRGKAAAAGATPAATKSGATVSAW